MTHHEVACAIPAAMASVFEESSSYSTLENAAVVGVTPANVGFGENDIVFDDGPTEVTDASILAELGMIERYGVRHDVGEAGTQRVSSGTLFASPVHPADVPVDSDVQLGYGVRGRNSVVAQTSFAALDDDSVRTVSKGPLAADGLVMGSSTAILDDNMAGAMLKERFAAAFAAENPFSMGDRQRREDLNLACRESGGSSRECPRERVSANPFATPYSYMPPQSPMPDSSNSLLPWLGGGSAEELVTIPKRMYYELLENKQHVERLLMIIAQLEEQCVQHNNRADACRAECIQTCERIVKEHSAKNMELEARCAEFERAFVHANAQREREREREREKEREIALVRTACHNSVLQERETSMKFIRELQEKVHNLEQASKPVHDVNDWYNDHGARDATRIHDCTRTFHIGEDIEPPKTTISVTSFQSCTDVNSRIARVLNKYDDKHTNTVRSQAAVSSDSTTVYQDVHVGVGPQSQVAPGGAFGVSAKPVGTTNQDVHVGNGPQSHVVPGGAFGVSAKPVGATTSNVQAHVFHGDLIPHAGSHSAFGVSAKPVSPAVNNQSTSPFAYMFNMFGKGNDLRRSDDSAFGASSKPVNEHVPNSAFSHVQERSSDGAFGVSAKPISERVPMFKHVFGTDTANKVELKSSAFGDSSKPANSPDLSHVHGSSNAQHSKLLSPLGRDSPINPFAMGNSFRDDRNRHVESSMHNQHVKGESNGDSAKVQPPITPTLPIFHRENEQRNMHGLSSNDVGKTHGNTGSAFGDSSKPVGTSGPCFGDRVGATGVSSRPNASNDNQSQQNVSQNQGNANFSFGPAQPSHQPDSNARASSPSRVQPNASHTNASDGSKPNVGRARRSSFDDDDDDDDDQSDTARRRVGQSKKDDGFPGLNPKSDTRRKIKVDSIELDHMPDPGHLRNWRVDMREKVTDAYSIDPDAALAWIKEVDSATSVHQLAANPYPELEVQLAKAMKKCIKHNKPFHAKMSQLIEHGQISGTRVTSRQIIYMMYEFLRPDTRGEDMYDLQDLFGVKLDAHSRKCSVEELASFLLRWDTCLTGINKRIDPDTMYTLFIKQIEEIELIEWEMKAFDKLPERSKTYEALYAICEDLIIKERKKKNSRQLHTRSRQNPVYVAAPAPASDAAPAPHKPSGTRSRSGSMRGRTRSPSRGSRHRSDGKPGHRSKSFSRSGSRGKNKHRSTSRKRTCIDFQKGKCTRGAGCKYLHDKDGKGSRSPNRSKPFDRRKSRSPSNKPKPKCILFTQGKCTYGDKCKYSHVKDAAPATPTRQDASNRSANSPAPEQSFP